MHSWQCRRAGQGCCDSASVAVGLYCSGIRLGDSLVAYFITVSISNAKTLAGATDFISSLRHYRLTDMHDTFFVALLSSVWASNTSEARKMKSVAPAWSAPLPCQECKWILSLDYLRFFYYFPVFVYLLCFFFLSVLHNASENSQ